MNLQDEFIKIDKLGRVLIPKKIRTDMGINDETLLRIDYDSSNKTISLSNAFGVCYECGTAKGIIPFGGKGKICNDCLIKMIKGITDRIEYRKEEYSESDDE